MSLFSMLTCKSIVKEDPVTPPVNLYDLSFISIQGDTVNFDQFKGKKLLIVNTASKCGFTPQFADLEELSEKYKDKLVIVGFPSNDFGSQDPGSNEEIAEFCQLNYGVKFLMMEKSHVKGNDKNTIYQWLTNKDRNGWNTEEPSWNFCKYLISEDGKLQAFFPSKVKPMSEDILNVIE